jgi:putative cell wall-binding protein
VNRKRRVALLAAVATAAVSFVTFSDTTRTLLRTDVGTVVSESLCGDMLRMAWRNGMELCAHGQDEHPSAASNRADNVTASSLPSVAPQCYDDGKSGARVQVLIVSAPQDPPSATDAEFRLWAGQVEWTFVTSASRDGGRRNVKWVTERRSDDGCQVQIEHVSVNASDLDDFRATVSAVVAQGYNSNDRKYMMFVQASVGICGLGSTTNDDRPTADNAANTGFGYARIDTECWDTGDEGFYSVAAHELAHNLGAVQPSAPHVTADRHCTDEWDLMCYDASGEDKVTVFCADNNPATQNEGDENNQLLDCGQDDYFDAGRPSGYLATHWNVASSIYLATSAGSGQGWSNRQPVASDPQNRPRQYSRFSVGLQRPVLRDAYGWEACNLPIGLTVVEPAPSQSVIGSLASSSSSPSSDLRKSVAAQIDWVNSSVGTQVLRLDPGSAKTSSTLLSIESAALTGRQSVPSTTQVNIKTDGSRITGAVITIDAARASRDFDLDVWVAQSLAQALGIGRDGGVGSLMSSWPTTSTDRSRAAALLEYLYGDGSCQSDRRIADTVGGDATQTRSGSTRERVTIAPNGTASSDVALASSAWLRGNNGQNWADVVVVCREDKHPDCLAGSALAGSKGPILFVPGGPSGRLPDAVRGEVGSALKSGGTIYVLGGNNAISPEIEAALRQSVSGAVVKRLSGATRYATAVQVALEVVRVREPRTNATSLPVAILARGDAPVDASVAGAYAAAKGVPILLTASDTLPGETAKWLASNGGTVVVIGGPRAVSDSVLAAANSRAGNAVRVAGPDRFATSVAIARNAALWNHTSMRGDTGVVAVVGTRANTWNTALAAAPIAATLGAPILYVTEKDIPTVVVDHLRSIRLAGDTALVTGVIAPKQTTISVAERFHAGALPELDGNVTVN